jgi:hypothetical protein
MFANKQKMLLKTKLEMENITYETFY